MTGETDARDRKAEHLDLARQDRMQLRGRHFDRFVLPHRALPEMAMEEVDPGVDFLGRRLGAPLLISCMTGGTGEAERINENLAWAAERRHIALGVGSQRKALEDPTQIRSFQVRRAAPSVPLLANLGAVQLNYGFGVEECRAAVDMIDADALVFHLNPLQEALQPEGQTDFGGLLEQMGRVARELQVPVVAKEVGNGISAEMARALMEQGITVVDTAGRGGTSWSRIEARRSGDVEMGEVFADWGIPTPEAIRDLARLEGLTVIGSGGVRSGVDVAKGLALGAEIVGMAFPFLMAASESREAVVELIDRTVRELRIAMFCAGARTVSELRDTVVHERSAPAALRIL